MICAGDKTKLMIVSTKQLRDSKLTPINKSLSLNVCGQPVDESSSEKLLGMIVENDLTWIIYMHGNNKTDTEKITGLLMKLSQIIGILLKLSKVLTKQQFNSVSNGVFTSLLIYCIQVFGHVWGIDKHDETNRKYTNFTKEDCRRLQVLQNKMLKLRSGLPYDFPTNDLLKTTGELSVHQLVAYHTLLQTNKTLISKKPSYIYEKLNLRTAGENSVFPQRQSHTIQIKKRLTLSRSCFIYRGASLFNLLPMELRISKNEKHFKTEVKVWVKTNIAIGPP